MRNGECEAGTAPSRAARVHEAIYRAAPRDRRHHQRLSGERHRLQRHRLPARQPHHSGELHRHPPGGRIPFGLQFEDPHWQGRAQIYAASRPQPCWRTMASWSRAPTFCEAFDRLEVLESTAEAIINCRTVGTLSPMPEAVTRELDRVFLGE